MSSDLIKPLLDNYQVYGINFKKKQINVFSNCDYPVNISKIGNILFESGIGSDTDFRSNKSKIQIQFPNIFQSRKQFTVIAKYKIISWNTSKQAIPFRGVMGTDANLYENGNFGIWNQKNDSYVRYGKAMGCTKGTAYEMALEQSESYVKFWLNGKLKVNAKRSLSFHSWLMVGDNHNNFETNMQAYYNDILVTDTAFLPNNYTVDWNDTWYEIHHKQVYNHTKESFWIPK